MQWNSLPDQFYPIPQQMSRRDERPAPSRSKKPRCSHPTTLNQRRRLRSPAFQRQSVVLIQSQPFVCPDYRQPWRIIRLLTTSE
jgi:hypothetical protein